MQKKKLVNYALKNKNISQKECFLIIKQLFNINFVYYYSLILKYWNF